MEEFVNLFFFIMTDGKNFFIRAKYGKRKCDCVCFFMEPKTGKHLDRDRKYHLKTFYIQKGLEWGKTEKPLPKSEIKNAEKILQEFLAKSKNSESKDGGEKEFLVGQRY